MIRPHSGERLPLGRKDSLSQCVKSAAAAAKKWKRPKRLEEAVIWAERIDYLNM